MTIDTSIVQHDVDRWFSEYFQAFIDIGAGKENPSKILSYWGVPLHTSNPKQSRWLASPDDVVSVLTEMQGVLRRLGYTHTVAIDKKITVYNETASRVETIMSRRNNGGDEIDRAAVSFELRRNDAGWIVISTAARPTDADAVKNVW